MDKEIADLIKRQSKLSIEQLERLLDLLEQKAEKFYQELARRIEKRLSELARDDGVVGLEQLDVIERYVDQQQRDMSVQRNQDLNEGLMMAVVLGLSATNKQSLQAIVPSNNPTLSNKVRQSSDHYGLRSGVAASQRAQSIFSKLNHTRLPDNLKLSDRIWRIDRGANDALKDMINTAVIKGWDAEQTLKNFFNKNDPEISAAARQVLGHARADVLGKQLRGLLVDGQGNAQAKYRRVLRTEILRYHGEAYMAAGEKMFGVVGFRFCLSPNHKKVDVCDRHATADLYNLGAGGYPDRASCPWPAHPNTWSFVTYIFDYEVPNFGKKESTPVAQPVYESSSGEGEADDAEPRMIAHPKQKKPKSKHPSHFDIGSHSLDGLIQRGRQVSNELLESGRTGLLEKIYMQLGQQREVGAIATNLLGRSELVERVKDVGQLFPASWIARSDKIGVVQVLSAMGEGGYTPNHIHGGGILRLTQHYYLVLHELSHRIQHVLPGLDDLFQDLHYRRTAGKPLIKLSEAYPNVHYTEKDVFQDGGYPEPYFGRFYDHPAAGKYGAMELMPMSFEYALSSSDAKVLKLIEKDRELFDFVMGALFHYDP